jgi:hypothetical protein
VLVNEGVVPPPEPRAQSVVSIDEETWTPQDVGSLVAIANEHVPCQGTPHAVSTGALSLQHVEQGSAALAKLERVHSARLILYAGLVENGSSQARPCARQVYASLFDCMAGEPSVVDAEPECKNGRRPVWCHGTSLHDPEAGTA